VYRASRTFYTGGRHRRGRRFYNAAQMIGDRGAGPPAEVEQPGCRLLLLDREDLRRAIHLKRVPTQLVPLPRHPRQPQDFRRRNYPHLLSETLPVKSSGTVVT
jgi:hypothetical protein